jgi:starvation-inducible DNA-binding protein
MTLAHVSTEARSKHATILATLLADTYLLQLKTQNFHWNVHGPQFHSLHVMFEQQYNELAAAVDDIAERIRTLGVVSPGSFAQFSKITNIKEQENTPSAEQMVKELAADHELIAKIIQENLQVAAESGDEGTVALLSDRLAFHEKTHWMLDSSVS